MWPGPILYGKFRKPETRKKSKKKMKKLIQSFVLFVIATSSLLVQSASQNATPRSREVAIVSAVTAEDMRYTVSGSGSGVSGSYLLWTPTSDGVLQQIGLTLAYPAESSPADIASVTLGTGEKGAPFAVATFGGSPDTIVRFDSPLVFKKNITLIIYQSLGLARVGAGLPGTTGHRVGVVFNSARPEDTVAITPAGKRFEVVGGSQKAGTGLFRAVPRIFTDGSYQVTQNGYQPVVGFQVYADGEGSVDIAKMTFALYGSAKMSSMQIFAYTDYLRTIPYTGITADGRVTQSAVVCGEVLTSVYPENTIGEATSIRIPAGGALHFTVYGEVTGFGENSWFGITPLADGGPSSQILAPLQTIDVAPNNNLIWSPNTSGSSGFETPDWHNGYGVQYLPVEVGAGGGKG